MSVAPEGQMMKFMRYERRARGALIPDGYHFRQTSSRSDELQVLELLRLVFPDKSFDMTLFDRVGPTFIVYDLNDKVVATASAGALSGRIGQSEVPAVHWVAVHPEHRVRGLGRLVVSAVQMYWALQGKTSVWAKLNPSTLGAEAMYKSLGFEEAG